MNTFRKYDHLERFGHSETDGVAVGLVHIFPKLDGTNGSVWFRGDEVQAGSRNRVLSADDDNQGFYKWLHSDDPDAQSLRQLVMIRRDWIFYGEWMVPHTLKTYRDETWRKFWIFDVYDRAKERYLSYEEYSESILGRKIPIIEPLCTIKNPSEEQLRAQVETNTYLIQDGAGLGEGVVIKNYAWENRYGRQPWAKIVRNEFKESNARTMGMPAKSGPNLVEIQIADEFCTPALVGKTRAKVVTAIANDIEFDLIANPNGQRLIEEQYRGRVIPQLLSRVYHDVVVEDLWTAVKKHKNPTVNFKLLNAHIVNKVKEYAGDLF